MFEIRFFASRFGVLVTGIMGFAFIIGVLTCDRRCVDDGYLSTQDLWI